MKKLRVILPAILTLAVSTSAAVTGTVAWFTATRLRTIDMSGVTVVNPEAGLLMTSADNVANTKVTFNGGAQTLSVVHGKDGSDNDVYLRDGSVDVGNDAVYRAIVSEAGAVTGYEEVASPYADVNGKKYDGKAIAYATKFTVGFKTTAVPTGNDNFNNCLFLNVETSTVTAPTQIKADTTPVPVKDANLLKSVRIGFAFDGDGDGTIEAGEWFVWAPLADDKAVTTLSEPAVDGEYLLKHVNGATLNTNNHTYTASEIIVGHNDPETDTTTVTTPSVGALNDSASPLGKTAAESYAGYLGVLTGSEKLLTVYTWFEGLDPNCVETNFTTVLKDIRSSLKFVMRRVANS